ncbi:NAD-dependent deacetylase sirtuin-2 [Marasmius fiardii PR-910]|nr:NAD-dependent deacetylase sirtuin-2 [Marasmius fiardii PR-910]
MTSDTKYQKQLKSLARYIESDTCKNVVLMLGAGVSTSAGIPDFRSPKTGLYANLARLKLPYPEAVFEIGFFHINPVPFYTLAHELYPGKYRPTPTHSFIRLLSEKGLLSMCLTQNIDTLERRAGVPADKIIEAHGSFAKQRCVKCKTPFDDEKMKDMVMNFSKKKEIPRCERKHCQGLVKPDIVFFGEALPPEFMKGRGAIQKADLLIVIGTSLTVHPFASLASHPLLSCPRVLINLDCVGDFDEDDESDYILLGKCDEVVQDLCRLLGWEDQLNQLWEETAKSVEVGSEVEAVTSKKDNAEEEVEKLAKQIQSAMDLKEKGKDEASGEPQASKSASGDGVGENATREGDAKTGPIQGVPLEDLAEEIERVYGFDTIGEEAKEDAEGKEKL